jgi:hypothetical protein
MPRRFASDDEYHIYLKAALGILLSAVGRKVPRPSPRLSASGGKGKQ